jgi:hypothetical protein
MGYDRDYGRKDGPSSYGGRARYDRDRGHDDYDRSRRGREPQGYDHDERGFFDRAGDEVRSWFGDEEAERRRRFDERYDQYEERSAGYGRASSGYGGGYGGGGFADRQQRPDYVDRPARSPYASSAGAMAGRSQFRHSGSDYDRWRDQQMRQLDDDYDEYSRERQKRFDDDFGSWRSRRQEQRGSLSRVTEHMEVVGSDGGHVGTVDKVRGDRIVLTKTDKDAGGHHHSIPCGWIENVDDKVTISMTADQAQSAWRDEERNQALFGNDRDGSNGPHVLNRSFSGTY